jgi:hypothetical protein
MTEYLGSIGPVPDNEIADFEAELRFVLPADYRHFLAQYGGGEPMPSSFSMAEIDDDSMVQTFYFATSNRREYASLRNMVKVFSDVFPDGLLPIGRDPGGNQIVLELSGAHTGRVLFWNHEGDRVDNIEQSIGLGDLTVLSPSFDDFVGTLYEDDAA